MFTGCPRQPSTYEEDGAADGAADGGAALGAELGADDEAGVDGAATDGATDGNVSTLGAVVAPGVHAAEAIAVAPATSRVAMARFMTDLTRQGESPRRRHGLVVPSCSRHCHVSRANAASGALAAA